MMAFPLLAIVMVLRVAIGDSSHLGAFSRRRSLKQQSDTGSPESSQQVSLADSARLGCEDSGFCSLGKVKHWQGEQHSGWDPLSHSGVPCMPAWPTPRGAVQLSCKRFHPCDESLRLNTLSEAL